MGAARARRNRVSLQRVQCRSRGIAAIGALTRSIELATARSCRAWLARGALVFAIRAIGPVHDRGLLRCIGIATFTTAPHRNARGALGVLSGGSATSLLMEVGGIKRR